MRQHLLPKALLLGIALLSATAGRGAEPPRSWGKEKAPAVTFETTDGVEIHGRFYRSTQGKKAPAVLLLHDPSAGAKGDDVVALARHLQRQGLAVLTFGFRGHGKSLAVDDRFWAVPVNRLRVRGFHPTNPRERVGAKDFSSDYYPSLVNDITAARAFLDELNDRSECNSSDLIVVGIGEGATLGALWLASECHRYEVTGRLGPRLKTKPEADSIRCAVWIDLDGSLAQRRVQVVDWVRVAGRDHKIPIGLLFSKDDRAAATTAARCLKAVKVKKDDAPLTDSRGVDGEAAERVDLVSRYVKHVLGEREPGEWEKKDFEDQTFVWNIAGRKAVAKAQGAKSLALVPLEWFGIR